jgi:SWI/SNF-related matrix-associated actin-dependent regulator 1 of chromatin subfamily A
MSDAEIHNFVKEHDDLAKFALDPAVFLEGGKMQALVSHIERCKAEGKRMLLFSQFTMLLNILQVALDHIGVKWTRLDGATRTDERQGLVDEFNEDQDITVFLLSTKAGGVGINLTAASVVVIFDQDFNPHNDRQAADRAYRIGQEREVEVIKLVSKGSIDEDILSIGMTKLQLDDKIAADEGGNDEQTAKEVKKSLLTTLKSKFQDDGEDEPMEEEAEEELPSTQVKRARGAAAA